MYFDDTVRVAVRVRPLVQSEIERDCQDSINVIPQENQLSIIGTDKMFAFNHVFESSIDQSQFYDQAVKGMVPNLFKGYNVTILAYGQTGSGKTFTMGTNYCGPESMGVIPTAIHDIFQYVQNKDEYAFRISVTFLELHKEKLYDLLAGDRQRKDCLVEIREENKEVKIIGLTEKEVKNADDTLKLLSQGSQGRATGATAMNNQSSRSHAIFTILIQQEKKGDPHSATNAKFHLVDLAGSERSKKTGATGERFKEGVDINRGLLALGNVISQLGENGGNTFIPYRDSKLTRLLQDSLGGNSVTLMIACISPADYNIDETLSTLRYADRARKIKNKPIINQDPKTAEINRLQAAIRELKLSLLNQGTVFTCPPEHAELSDKNRELQKKLRQLMERFNTSLINTMCMNERGELAENAKEQLCDGLTEILQQFTPILQDESLAEYHRVALKEIHSKITNLLDHQKKIDVEIINHISCPQIPPNSDKSQKLSTSGVQEDDSSNTLSESMNGTMELDEEHAEHTLRQAERENEVQTINRALALKEELVLKLLNNASELSEYTKEMQDMENEIKTLQAEKEQWLKTLENAQNNAASAKLAETRRKKVQELEKKIAELSRKCIEQNRVIKAKEKSDVQVKNLASEIQSLKQTRVKLVREMRKEAEKFSQYKLMRERELHKLKDQDRKRQNQIVRMQTQHNKQQNVSKRKMEEACAVIKRLKDAMEKQRQAQMRREKSKTSKEEIKTCISQEISMLLNTTEAKCSLEKLMKDRTQLTAELETLKQQKIDNPSAQLNNQIIDSTEYIELRNVQIADLQQKIVEADEENRTNCRLKTVQSLGDAKVAIEMLSDTIVESEKKYHMKCSEYDELMEKYDQSLMNFRKYELREKNRNESDNSFNVPEISITNTDQDEENEIEKLKRELEILQKQNERLQGNQQPKKPRNPRVTQILVEEPSLLDFTDDSIIVEDDDVENDPDWRKTPMHKRSRATMFKSIGDTSDEKISTKRNSDGEIKCSCRTKCTSQNCSCKKNRQPCGKGCGCSSKVCENKDKSNVSRPYFSDISQLEMDGDAIKRLRTGDT